MTVGQEYKSPRQLLEELGIMNPEDLDIEAIAQYCGATILYEPIEGSEARILGYRDRAIITVNPSSSRQRQRFSAGHELGHWMRDRGKISFACTDRVFNVEWSNDTPEKRANRYAAELLLPEFLFAPRARNKPLVFDSVRSLAEIFQTSITATAIRLVDLGSFPAMLVCSEGQQRRWFVRGPDVAECIWPHEQLSRNTVASELLRGEAATAPTDLGADAWVDHPDARQYNVREDSMKIGQDLVLSLIWWKDEQQLLDLQGDDPD